ncbi:MAG: SDR family oxidoreductase [Brevundimonas sp.]|uniref:SDR family NAD(P)-dependent oxidoreductase n=1 Tax=Brevundimonas sp. TaxID=1871086 RepID=UPI0025C11CDB|nr:SDR family oxidoreductase [Brevundimonas sp.]MBX3477550.1 SDR family oxidoreductase [Brevundimonas sp.]
MRRTILITGASAGIGADLARECARRGHDLILTARREAPMRVLAEEIGAAAAVTVLVEDLADPQASARLAQAIAARGLTVDGLVNNAGFSRTSGFLNTDPADHAAMVRVMLSAPVELARLFAPGMVQRGYGRILNVASLAGRMPATGGDTLYGPIKSFLIKWSQGLHLEMAGTGVQVTVLNPGYTLTEFHDANGTRDQVSAAYPAWMWMRSPEVARIGWAAVEANRPSVTPGLMNNLLAGLAKHLPDGMALRMVGSHARRLGRV